MRLERLILAQDIVEISRDLEKDADLDKLRDAQERAERRSIGNANAGNSGQLLKSTSINARPARTSGLGATPHEERPFEEARNEDGRDERGARLRIEGVEGEGGGHGEGGEEER